METDGAHLLHGGAFQVVVDFLGVLAVLSVFEAHTLHLAALGIQGAVDVPKRLLDTVPVHHVLAGKGLSQFVQVGQMYGGILRTQFAAAAAGGHLARELVQVGHQVTMDGLFACTDTVRRQLDITQNVSAFVGEVQVVLQDAGALGTKNLHLRQPP